MNPRGHFADRSASLAPWRVSEQEGKEFATAGVSEHGRERFRYVAAQRRWAYYGGVNLQAPFENFDLMLYHTDLPTKKRWFGEPFGGPDTEIARPFYVAGLETKIREMGEAAADSARRMTDVFGTARTREQWLDMERTLEAYRSGDRAMLLWNVLQSHQTRTYEQAVDILQAILADPKHAELAARYTGFDGTGDRWQAPRPAEGQPVATRSRARMTVSE